MSGYLPLEILIKQTTNSKSQKVHFYDKVHMICTKLHFVLQKLQVFMDKLDTLFFFVKSLTQVWFCEGCHLTFCNFFYVGQHHCQNTLRCVVFGSIMAKELSGTWMSSCPKSVIVNDGSGVSGLRIKGFNPCAFFKCLQSYPLHSGHPWGGPTEQTWH